MLCRVTTTDGLQLDGDVLVPESPRAGTAALLFVHGTGSNFYAPGILEQLALHAFNAGHVTLRINTRGHDGIASIPGQPKSVKGGATFEIVSDCVADLTAWCDFLVAQGAHRIVLVGHSMGGVKSIYSQARAPHPRVSGMVCLSPPRFCHQHWLAHPQGAAFRDHLAEATALMAAGQPQALFECRQPTPFLATATGFLEKYGSEDRYDLVPLLMKVAVPTLVLLGDQTWKSSPAFDSLPSELTRLSDRGWPVRFELITGADMSYSSQLAEVWSASESMLRE